MTFAEDIPFIGVVYILFIIGCFLSMYIARWGVKQKGRNSDWWLLIFVPFGFIVLLCLKNKRQKQTDDKNHIID